MTFYAAGVVGRLRSLRTSRFGPPVRSHDGLLWVGSASSADRTADLPPTSAAMAGARPRGTALESGHVQPVVALWRLYFETGHRHRHLLIHRTTGSGRLPPLATGSYREPDSHPGQCRPKVAQKVLQFRVAGARQPATAETIYELGDRSFKRAFSSRWGRDGEARALGRGFEWGLCG